MFIAPFRCSLCIEGLMGRLGLLVAWDQYLTD